ncbi:MULTISPECIES: hypothetical protein [unclassified Rhizobium]|uniref:hypothetical protein n=1 Tax=unclassified Rhizobium TaxID=2613769 RepID=UPI0013AF9CE9|nr:hypothetical protein [Rhizobium sp. UBA1881]
MSANAKGAATSARPCWSCRAEIATEENQNMPTEATGKVAIPQWMSELLVIIVGDNVAFRQLHEETCSRKLIDNGWKAVSRGNAGNGPIIDAITALTRDDR